MMTNQIILKKTKPETQTLENKDLDPAASTGDEKEKPKEANTPKEE